MTGMFFSLFSRGFVRFLTTSSKKFEKTTMKQKIQIRRLYKAKHFPRIFLFFRVFLVFDQKWQNPRGLGDYMRPEAFPSNLCLLFLFFFGFLKIFATFSPKPKKLEKTKKNEKNEKTKKNKKTKKPKIRRLYEARHFPQIFGFFGFFGFFWFFWFSRGFFGF